jgi:hypothetical protein
MRTSKHRRFASECGGPVTVHVTPDPFTPGCHPDKHSIKVRITRGRQVLWEPKSPICLGPQHSPDSGRGRNAAADAAVDFFEHYKCGAQPLERAANAGGGRYQRRKRKPPTAPRTSKP